MDLPYIPFFLQLTLEMRQAVTIAFEPIVGCKIIHRKQLMVVHAAVAATPDFDEHVSFYRALYGLAIIYNIPSTWYV